MRNVLRLVESLSRSWVLLAFLAGADEVRGQSEVFTPKIAPASREASLALQRIRVPAGMSVELFAAEPMLANPVCFCVDEKNRFYVAETFRLHAGVPDIRYHMEWLDDDLASRSVADRVAMLKKHLKDEVLTYGVAHDRVRLIEDTDGDGKADRSTVFADGFHNIPDGIGAGLLARGGKVWYSCIPDLWLLRDPRGEGKATSRQSLHHGYGVHVGFLGHDLHGLRMGPDGRIYFSIGDRGLLVNTGGKRVASQDCGAVLRCNPDGSELEIVATGLRNPQELAFDALGNLFTVDNNADHGDQARLVSIVEGGDSGWRIGYQFLKSPVDLGPWNAEKLWEPAWEGQPAYIVPPIANLANGPSGLTYHPGVSQLPDRYQGHFFLCDFRGGSGKSGIHAFSVRPRGATFELAEKEEFVWLVLATDVDFGMDGALYLTDWVEGWELPGKGRILKVFDPAKSKSRETKEVQRLMAEGMNGRATEELGRLLAHADMRVRQEAQFALADKGKAGLDVLRQTALKPTALMARLHAIWGMGQMARKTHDVYSELVPLLSDREPEVRAQAAKVIGEGKSAAALEPLLKLLGDSESRVRFFAAVSLGKLGRTEALRPVLQMIRENADRDPYLRHAGVMALAGVKDASLLAQAANDPSPAVRMGILLALRRLESPEVARFLHDPEPRLVVEAARAINDQPIPAAFHSLAGLIEKTSGQDAFWYRVLNAQYRLGGAENAAALAQFATRRDVDQSLRIEALNMLAGWEKPSNLDRVIGIWRPLTARNAEAVRQALKPMINEILRGPDRVREEGIKLAVHYQIQELGGLLVGILADNKASTAVRKEAFSALEGLKDARLAEGLKLVLADESPELRNHGRRLLAKLRPREAITELEQVLQNGTLVERQGAFAILGTLESDRADKILCHWLDQLKAQKVPQEVFLELLEAARKRHAPQVRQKVADYEKSLPKDDPLAPYRESLAGGNAEAGRNIFLHKDQVSCVRCHKMGMQGGDVGPDLAGIGKRQTRQYLLESVVAPNRQIAKGFETVVLMLNNGQIVTGVLKKETPEKLELMTSEAKLVHVSKNEIEERQTGKSAMPEDTVKSLSRAELRDLVEFLANLK